MHLGTWIIGAIAAWTLVGCGIGEKVSDPCNQIRGGYASAGRKVSGLRSRNLGRTNPTYERATQELARARQALSRCEAEYGMVSVSGSSAG